MKKNMFIRYLSFASIACLLLSACGKSGNMFEKVYKPTEKEKAKQSLEEGDCDSAQTQLASYLEDSPSDSEAKQMYYDAVSACLDLGMESLIEKMGNPSDANGDFSKLVAMMPEATQENIDKLQKAVDALKSINPRTTEQEAQLAMASMSAAATTAKMVAMNDDGSLNQEKAANMSEEQAQSVIDNIQTANSSLAASGAGGSQTQAISNVSSGIASAQGDTAKDKLNNYLQSRK